MAGQQPGNTPESVARLVIPISSAVAEFIDAVDSDIRRQVRTEMQECDTKLGQVMYLYHELERHQRILEHRLNEMVSGRLGGVSNNLQDGGPRVCNLDPVIETLKRKVEDFIAEKRTEFATYRDAETRFTRDEVIGFLEDQQCRILDFVAGQQQSVQHSVQEKLQIVVREILEEWTAKRATEYEERMQVLKEAMDLAVYDAINKIVSTAKTVEEQLTNNTILESKFSEMKDEMREAIDKRSDAITLGLKEVSMEYMSTLKAETETTFQNFTVSLLESLKKKRDPRSQASLVRRYLREEVTEQVNLRTGVLLRAILEERRAGQQMPAEHALEQKASENRRESPACSAIRRPCHNNSPEETYVPCPSPSNRTRSFPRHYSDDTEVGSTTNKRETASLTGIMTPATAAGETTRKSG